LTCAENIWYPYAAELNVDDLQQELWSMRTMLAERSTFQGNMADAKLDWWDYMQHTASAYRTPRSIAFAFVATHNHFVLDRGGKVFNRAAPVIKLPAEASEDDHLALLGVLNSSSACFWLKQVSQPKAGGGLGRGIQDEPWEERYELTSGNLEKYPLPASLP